MATMVDEVVTVELAPLERSLQVVYVSEALFDKPTHLELGDRLTLRDEGGFLYDGVVVEIEGRRSRVRFEEQAVR